MEHPFTWNLLTPFLPQHVFFAIVVAAILIGIGVLARMSLSRAKDPIIPDAGLSLRNILELVVSLIISVSDGIVGKKGRKFVPMFASFFCFILLSNLSGLLPGFSPPTSNLNTTLGLGFISFLAYNIIGVREHGGSYIKQFMGPVLFLAPFFIILELVSHMVRPVSLGLRLFGNMFGDHLVIEIFTDLTKVAVPVVFYMLGTLVSVIQASVFTILSIIYVAMAVSHEH
ncbi:MAG: F0F1 ATP synthase subunit A [Deltaproteobacteria bacterium]|nr:F0F1 ATP synthase subunit A [Deltaproteobacteria bacterium]